MKFTYMARVNGVEEQRIGHLYGSIVPADNKWFIDIANGALRWVGYHVVGGRIDYNPESKEETCCLQIESIKCAGLHNNVRSIAKSLSKTVKFDGKLVINGEAV